MKLKEKDIQELLFSTLIEKRHTFIVPNVHLFKYWESDLISVTTSGFINEYEIKTSRADFLSEKRKKKFYIVGNSNLKYQANYFYYVTTGKVLKFKEIPDYAGFIFITNESKVKLIKKPKIIHRNKITDRYINYLSRGLMHRYWRGRINQF